MNKSDYKIVFFYGHMRVVPFNTLPDGSHYAFWGDSIEKISSNFTGIDWGKHNPELKKRTKRVDLDDDKNNTN